MRKYIKLLNKNFKISSRIKFLKKFFLPTYQFKNGYLKNYGYKKFCHNSEFVNYYKNIIIDKKRRETIFFSDQSRAFGHLLYDFFLANSLALKNGHKFILVNLMGEKFSHYIFKNTNIENQKIIKNYNFKKFYYHYKKIVCSFHLGKKYSFKNSQQSRNINYFDSKILSYNHRIAFNLNDLKEIESFLEKRNPEKKKIIILNSRNSLITESKNIISEKNRTSDENIYDKLILKNKEFYFIKVGLPDSHVKKKPFFENYYDFSNSGLWNNKVETLLIHKAYACIYPASGGNFLPRLLGKYMLTLNLICPFLHYPKCKNEIGIMKKIKKNNSLLKVSDYKNQENLCLDRIDNLGREFEIIDNSEEEILYGFEQLKKFREKKLESNILKNGEIIKKALLDPLKAARKNNLQINKWTGNDYDIGDGILIGDNLTV